MNTENKRKPGRPPKQRNLILYKSGTRMKAYNPDLGVNVNISEKDLQGNVTVYKGLGWDYVNWGRKLTRGGFYNAANCNPFNKPGNPIQPDKKAQLEADYNRDHELARVLDACSRLFEGNIPDDEKPILLRGTWWMRVIGKLFIDEAGAEGISRTRFEKPSGKIWASVNALASQGGGYNYSLEAWSIVKNMRFAPVFCIRMEVSDDNEERDPGAIRDWNPSDLANAILHSLWAHKGVNSCEADVFAVETTPQPPPVASGSLPTSEDTSGDTPLLSGDPDAVSVEEAPEPEIAPRPLPEATPMTQADAQFTGSVIPEATPPAAAGKNWGEIKQTPIWMKGLTSSRELQAPAPLSRILDTVVSHEATRRMTEECRALTEKKDRNEYKRDNLHVWYPSAVFAGRLGGSGKENVIGYTGLGCLDFDNMGSMEEACNVRDDLFMEFPEVLFSAVSASGLGVYALVMLDFDGSEEGYKAALSAAMEAFEAKGFMPDVGCVDATRARYMSSDPDALQRPDGYAPKTFSASTDGGFILPASMLRSCWTNSGRKKKGAGKVYLDEALRRIETAQDGMKDSTITSVMGSVARLIRNYGLDADKTYDKVREVAFACGYCTKKTNDKIKRLGVKTPKGDSL